LLLEIGDHLYHLLKLSVLRLHVVLKVDNPMGMDIASDVKQLMGVVPPILGLTNSTISDLQLTVLL
jgi:hypothetical protein